MNDMPDIIMLIAFAFSSRSFRQNGLSSFDEPVFGDKVPY
jgi:hypothetical protein